jgi:DNA-binding GntR family transcriptional regulator
MAVSTNRRLPELVHAEPSTDGDLSALVPVGRETLLDQVYIQLRQSLMMGRFRPGQALTLRSVSEALGVSHMPVRGALQRLEAEGALEAPANRRTLIVPELRVNELLELRDIRMELEGLAAERAAVRISRDELIKVEQQCDLMEAAAKADDIDGYITENWAFHTAVYESSHLKLLLPLIEGFWLRIGPYVRLMMTGRENMVASIPNHRDVVEALRNGDAVKARKAIGADIRDSAEHLRKSLSA